MNSTPTDQRLSQVVAPSGRRGETAILSAALEVLAARGFNGMSMRDVATSAGTSLSNLYNYFPSKADLVAVLLSITNDDLRSRIEVAVAPAADPVGRLHAAIEAYIAFNVEKPLASLVGISEIRYLDGDRRAGVIAARDKTERIFKDIVQDGVAEGVFHPKHPAVAARALVTMLAGMVLWFHADGPLGARELAAQHVELGRALLRVSG